MGSWRGTCAIESPLGSDPGVQATLAAVKLVLKSDGTFLLTEMGFGMEGSASLGSYTGTLHIQRLMGRNLGSVGGSATDIKRERSVQFNKNGTITIESSGEEMVVLSRISAD